MKKEHKNIPENANMTELNKPAHARNTTGLVLDAVRDMHAQEQSATREALAEATGLKLSVIDDRTRALVDDSQLLRLKRGVFIPVVVHPAARIMSKTILPDGWVKLEVGDDMLTLTPRESRMLSAMMAGEAMQLTAIEASRQAAVVHAELARRITAVERENRALLRERTTGPNAGQMVLMGD